MPSPTPVPPRDRADTPWRSEGAPPSPPPRKKMPGGWRGLILAALIVYLITNVVLGFFNEGDGPTISYTEFSKQVTDGNVQKIYSKGDAIQGELKTKQPVPGGHGDYRKFVTQRPAFADDQLWTGLTSKGVTVTASPVVEQRSFLANLLISLAPMLLIVALWLLIARRMGSALGGAGGFGRKAPPKPVELEGAKRTTFEDVAGIDEVEGELSEVVDFLRTPTSTTGSAPACPAGCCSPARPAPARPSSPAPSRARPGCPSSRPPPPSSSR